MTGAIFLTRQEILKVEWKIKEFLSMKGSLGCIWDSSKFTFSDVSYYLGLYPFGEEGSEDFVGFYLFCDESHNSPSVIFTLAIQKTDGTLISRDAFVRQLQNGRGTGISKMISRSDLMQKKAEFMAEDTVTFICFLKNSCPVEAMDALSLDFKKLFVSSTQSDLTVKLKSRTYKAHRAVLAARSEVLSSALEHEMIEKESGVISIEDCDPDSFKEFLQYLYTSRANITEGNVFHLYKTANKYLVNELKLHCTAFMIENLSVDNVCDVIALADLYDDSHLTHRCKEFFSKKAGSIFLTSKWKSLMISNSKIASELLEHIAPKLADED